MSVLPEDSAKETKGLDLGQDKHPIERAFGLHWCIESDTFKFRIEMKDRLTLEEECCQLSAPSVILWIS